jgi:hypothetical protein
VSDAAILAMTPIASKATARITNPPFFLLERIQSPSSEIGEMSIGMLQRASMACNVLWALFGLLVVAG